MQNLLLFLNHPTSQAEKAKTDIFWGQASLGRVPRKQSVPKFFGGRLSTSAGLIFCCHKFGLSYAGICKFLPREGCAL